SRGHAALCEISAVISGHNILTLVRHSSVTSHFVSEYGKPLSAASSSLSAATSSTLAALFQSDPTMSAQPCRASRSQECPSRVSYWTWLGTPSKTQPDR